MNVNNTCCVFLLLPQSLFHANSLQKTHQSALQVQQKAEVTVGSLPSQQPGRHSPSHPPSLSPLQMMLQAGHYDPEAIRNCAEKVAVHWQQLMLKMEDRLKLVNASVAFYKTSEQVCGRTLGAGAAS